MKFTELNLPQYIIDAVAKQGFEEATEIQSKCLPLIMEGKDVIGKSQTGSGKTIAYAIPAIEKVDTTRSCVQVLVVCPTRELAIQVCEEFKKITAFKESCKVVPIFGGNSMDRQKMALKNGAKIVVGTPGRIMDHLRRRTLKMDFLKMAVLDEADEMLNMGFKEDIETILAKVNPERQTVMFSATLPAPILKITNEFMKNPILIEVGNKNETTKLIKQSFVFHEKKDALIQLCLDMKPTTSIIFCNTKKMVDDVTDMLVLNGLKAVSLHGDMRQSARQKAMQELKSGKVNYLVATDVAARGIDVKNVDIIFNYDIPKDVEYYIHRIGRTGRAGLTGVAISFVTTRMQIKQLALIEKETKATINQILLNGDTAQDKYLQETNFLNEKSSRGVSFSGERKKNFSAPSFKNNFTGSHQGKSQNFNISKRTNSKPLGKSFNNELATKSAEVHYASKAHSSPRYALKINEKLNKSYTDKKTTYSKSSYDKTKDSFQDQNLSRSKFGEKRSYAPKSEFKETSRFNGKQKFADKNFSFEKKKTIGTKSTTGNKKFFHSKIKPTYSPKKNSVEK